MNISQGALVTLGTEAGVLWWNLWL